MLFSCSPIASIRRICSRKRLDLLPQTLGLGLHLRRLRAVGRLQRVQVALDALLDLLLTPLDLVRREVAVAAVDRLELAAVDRDDRLREQLQLAAQLRRSGGTRCGCPRRCPAGSRRWS